MEDLAGKLREAYDSVTFGEKLAAVQLFAIRHAKALAGFRSADLKALAAKAGIGMLYGGEMRLAIQMASLVPLEFLPEKDQITNLRIKKKKSKIELDHSVLVDEIKELCENTPAGELTVRLYLFGLENEKRLRGRNVSKLVAASGLPVSIYSGIGKGRKLALYLKIRADAESHTDLAAKSAAIDAT